MLRACFAHIVHFVCACVAVLHICVSEVSLEISPLHLVFNEGPKERVRPRGRERSKRRREGAMSTTVLAPGVKARVFIGLQ